MLKDHPLLGIGLGHYKVRFLEYKAKFLATERGKHYDFYILRAAQAHNEYVQTAAEMGGLGILAGGFALFALFSSGFRRLKAAKAKERFIILSLLAGIVAALTHALVSFPFHLPASALAFVLLLGLLNSGCFCPESEVQSLRSKVQGPSSEGKGFGHWTSDIWLSLGRHGGLAILSFALVLGISVSTLAYRDWLADLHLDRGERLLKLGKIEEARIALEKSLALDFSPSKGLYWLGSIYHMLGEERNDQALLERSLMLLERSRSSFQVEPTYLQLAQLYLNFGEFDRARESVNRLLATSPSPERALDARYLTAVIAWKEGDLEEAVRRLDELLGRRKDYERGYITRAKIYLQQGKSGLARLDLEKAHKLITRKLNNTRVRLSRLKDQGLLTLDKYAELRGELVRLEGAREEIERLLRELPK